MLRSSTICGARARQRLAHARAAHTVLVRSLNAHCLPLPASTWSSERAQAARHAQRRAALTAAHARRSHHIHAAGARARRTPHDLARTRAGAARSARARACRKLNVTSEQMPSEDSTMPSVGVPKRERRASTLGRNPRSAMPSSWKESLLISASNWPTCAGRGNTRCATGGCCHRQ